MQLCTLCQGKFLLLYYFISHVRNMLLSFYEQASPDCILQIVRNP